MARREMKGDVMAVNNVGPTPPPSGGDPIRRRRASSTSSAASSAASAADSPPARETPLAVSPETAELLAQLRELPEVREDLVKEVQRRLKDGEYLTPEAAQKTAQAILEDLSNDSSSIDTIAGW